jgi:hypothetical protein
MYTPIRVVCRTNLDLFHEEWPRHLPAVPNVGDHIESKTRRGQFQLRLAVVRITYKHDIVDYGSGPKDYWYPEIELGMTNFHRELRDDKGSQGSLVAFYTWYAPLVGKTVSYFI